MQTESTILLTKSQVTSLLNNEECIAAVENAFRQYGEGVAKTPSIMGVHVDNGGFHVKAGVMELGRDYFVSKTNANFPQNPKSFNLPTIQGVIIIADAKNGRLLALTDSIEITTLRTGAATAVAAKYLSKEDSSVATIVGCGNQGRVSIRMLAVVRNLKNVFVYDTDEKAARQLADEMDSSTTKVVYASQLDSAVAQSDICVTCTPSKMPFLKKEWISPGTFIAAVGSDNEDKQELEVSILKTCKLVTDITNQCATIGELHHAIEEGTLTKNEVYSELGEIVAGKKPGRSSKEEIIVFDSTGMALQDVAASAIVYEKAIKSSVGHRLNFMD